VTASANLAPTAGGPRPDGGRQAVDPTGSAAASVVIGRQGVYTSDLELDGYQLLFQPDPASTPGLGILGTTQQTNVVLAGALNIGLSDLVGNRRIYVHVGDDLLADPWREWLPSHRTVVELQEATLVDSALLYGCGELRDQGFTIALDDFGWTADRQALLDLAAIVKVDVRATSRDELTAIVDTCLPYGVELLADKVEDIDQIDELRVMGFTRFQGYALECPRIVAGRTIDVTSLARLRSAAMMLDADIEITKLEQIIRTEPAMAYQLIKLACIGQPGQTARSVSSLRDALVLLGTRRVQQFIAILLSRPSRQDDSREFLAVLARARACELLVAASHPPMASVGFAAGLISALDAVLGVPVPEITESMGLSGPLADALLEPSSPVGAILADVIECQRRSSEHNAPASIRPDDLGTAYRDALAWAAHTMSATAADE
jgi:EAL and modified HD-GYP domain-containing signal transduction protein